MKKTILSIAVLLASMAGISATAQTQAPAQQTTTECSNTNNCTKVKGNRQGAKADKPNPFAGLNLTEQQQTALKALKPSKDAQCNANSQNKQQKQQLSQAEKQAQRKQKAESRIENRKNYLAKVKDILTPEQYVQFLENSYVDQGVKAQGNKNFAKNKKGNKGQKGQNISKDGRNKDQAMRGNKQRNGQNNGQGRKGNKQNNVNATQQNNATADGSYYIDNGLIKVFPYQAQR